MQRNAFLIESISLAPVTTILPDRNRRNTTLGFCTRSTAPGKSVGTVISREFVQFEREGNADGGDDVLDAKPLEGDFNMILQ